MSSRRILVASLLSLAIELSAQQATGLDGPVARLREIANRQTATEADVARRTADADAWLDAMRDRDLGELEVLRTIAGTFTRDPGARRRSSAELVEWFRSHDGLPAPGFAECAGRIVLFDIVARAGRGSWSECEALLPLLLRACRDHRAVFWLLGRRGRDAGTAEGRQFLQQTVIPALLADHAMDDAERVHILRLLYEVDYTGPRPFTEVAGPGLDGREVRTADYRGRVLLVDYWATWCRPCLAAMPGVVAAHRRFRDQGFDVIGISIDEADRRERVLSKVEELGMEFPILFDGEGWASERVRANNVLAIPATFLVDRKGRVRYTGLEGDELQQRIAELLAEK